MCEKTDISRSIDGDNWGRDEDYIVINMQSRPSEADARSVSIDEINPPKVEKEKP